MNDHPTKTRPNKGTPKQVSPRKGPCSVPFARSFLAALLFLNLSVAARAESLKQNPDFSSYDVPLYEQITNRIKAKVLSRLGDGRSTRDRYFIIPFAYQNRGNDPRYSHSFLSVIRILPDDKQTKLTRS